jgi:GT2 family glycosyltransferase/glycosyltransferase involved in cell wall biosynthesis/SAM-dependent methyltransferase
MKKIICLLGAHLTARARMGARLYGRLKARLLARALVLRLLSLCRRIRTALRRIRQKHLPFPAKYGPPTVEAFFQVRPGPRADTWESEGPDPQLTLVPPFPRGWVRLTVHIEAATRRGDRARLYLDNGAGYNETDTYDLGPVNSEHARYLSFTQNTVGLRLDPMLGPGTFRIRKLEIHPVSLDEAREAISKGSLERFNQKDGEGDALHAEPPQGFVVPKAIELYDAWLEVNQWGARRESLLRKRLAGAATLPRLSVIMPVYNPPLEFLDLAIRSVVGQVYESWELCAADDASADQGVGQLLRGWAAQEPRIRAVFRSDNGGISAASNTAAETATGEYLVFLDNDDQLAPDALGEVALYLSEHPDTDVLYSDEDKVDALGRRYDPQFKPDWSPELLLSFMYMAHLLVIRRSLFQELGGLRSAFDGSQDYDLALRATEAARHVGHIPKVLYHWRSLPTSTASSGHSKPGSFRAGQTALEEALQRRGVKASVSQPDWAVRAACGYFTHQFPDTGPKVAIIIPTRNQTDVLSACIDSLARTTYRNYEVVIVDNGSDNPATLEYLKASPHRVLRILSAGGQFNFAALNNEAVREVDCDYVLFLNDDTEVISPAWLSQMVGYLGISGVGAVGARLIFPDGVVQHAGVVHSRLGVGPWHAFRLTHPADPGHAGYSLVARNYSAVTAACMLTPRELFLEQGGFDQDAFPVAYNDVDYCYRLLASGYRVVYCPTAELVHHEARSRGDDHDPGELANLRSRYREFRDRYYNPNLFEDGTVRVQARTVAPRVGKPIRALMCTVNLNLEGAPIDQLEMTVGLRDRGVIEPIVHSPQDGPLRAEYERLGIRVEVRDTSLGSVFNPEGYTNAIGAFAAWLKDLEVEIVYGNTLMTFYAIAAAKEAGLPSIWNPRESQDWQTYYDGWGHYVAGRALRCFEYPYMIVFTANASLNRFKELCSRHNFTNIHDGLDRSSFEARLRTAPREAARDKLGVQPDEVVILTAGVVCERKGQLDVVGALSRLSTDTVRHIRWFVVGERPGPDSIALRASVEAMGGYSSTRVIIVPETPAIIEYYAAADIYCCTSRWESFPRVILEAMAAGLPIITTPVNGIVEQVRRGRNGLFYEPGDVAGLADNVSLLVNDQELRQRLGRASPVVLSSIISYESMLEAYAEVFREAWLSGCPRAGDRARTLGGTGTAHSSNGNRSGPPGSENGGPCLEEDARRLAGPASERGLGGPRYSIDEPPMAIGGSRVESPFWIKGWLAPQPGCSLSAVEIRVNGVPRARAVLGLKREDVQTLIGGLDTLWSGFEAELFVDGLVGQAAAIQLVGCFQERQVPLAEFRVQVQGVGRVVRRRERSWTLQELLACPECFGRMREEVQNFRCDECGRGFEKRRGTPIFVPAGQLVQSRLLHTAPTHPNTEAYDLIIKKAAGGIVLDYGAGNPRQSDYHPNVVFHEFVQYANTDVVSTCDRLPYRDNTFDAVISKAVFEHLARPWEAAMEIHRVLKPGGVVHVDTAFMQPLHGDPHHYFNMTLAGVREIFKPFKHVRSGIKPYQLPSFGYQMQIESMMDHLRSEEWRLRLQELKEAIMKDLDASLDEIGRERVAAGFFFEGVKEQ